MANLSLVELDSSNFGEQVLESDMPCLVDFWAEWCMPCKLVAPAVEQIAQEYGKKIKVCKFDLDKGQEIAMRYGIMSIPTLGIFKGGQMVDTVIGVVPKEQI